MQARILHHLFRVVGMNIIKGPLWDVSAQGSSAHPSNTAYVEQQVSQLLSTSFPNMQPQQVEVGSIHQDTPSCNISRKDSAPDHLMATCVLNDHFVVHYVGASHKLVACFHGVQDLSPFIAHFPLLSGAQCIQN